MSSRALVLVSLISLSSHLWGNERHSSRFLAPRHSDNDCLQKSQPTTFEIWDKLSPKEKYNVVLRTSKIQPENWGYISFYQGARTERLEENPENSIGFCLGVATARRSFFPELVRNSKVPDTTKKEIERIHNIASERFSLLIDVWIERNTSKRTGAITPLQARQYNRFSFGEILSYAEQHPGGIVGLKVKGGLHAVQVFKIEGKLYVVDPNVGRPMQAFQSGDKFVWETSDSEVVGVADYVYPPPSFWND